jgi:pectate lyase
LLPSDVLEWTWFLNSFSDKHIYDFMYGDKDTFGVGFGLAGKAHMYQHINVPPGEKHIKWWGCWLYEHIYDFLYGDKDTFGVGFGLAGKAHMYQHINVPPGGRTGLPVWLVVVRCRPL